MKKPFKIPETITEQELRELIKKSKSKKHRLAFLLGFYQAMRVSEVVAIKPEDVNKETKLLHIRQAKGSKDRMSPIAPEIYSGLKHLPVGIGIRALQIAFKKLGKEVLNKDLHFHCLRHSGITHYLTKKKWSSLEVQRLAGHSRVSTTEIYAHINPVDLVDRMWEK